MRLMTWRAPCSSPYTAVGQCGAQRALRPQLPAPGQALGCAAPLALSGRTCVYCSPRHPTHLEAPYIEVGAIYAVLVRGANEDGAWRGLVNIFEFIDPRPYSCLPPVYERLIYTVLYMSDCL